MYSFGVDLRVQQKLSILLVESSKMIQVLISEHVQVTKFYCSYISQQEFKVSFYGVLTIISQTL